MTKLAHQVAIITGASKGIGRAIALRLAGQGATVVLAARSETNLAQVVQAITEAGGTALDIPTDLADEAQIVNLVEQTAKHFNRLDILINNAGIVYAGPQETTPTADYDKVMAVNARAPYILTRQAIPLLKQAPRATIINVASVVGVKGYPNQTLYTSSKHALRGMSIALAEELKPNNIRVHVICPGGTATEMVSKVRPDINPDELIQPDEIAELIEYLTTHTGNAIIDELHIRRQSSSPWF